jgi:AraC-like DNA-binding protein
MAVDELRSMFPTIALLAYCALTADAMRRVARAGRAHLNGVIIRGIDDAGPQLRAVLSEAEDESVAATVMAMVADTAPKSVWPVLQYCLRNARAQLTVEEVALALDVTRQALAKRLDQAGLPAASSLVAWCRLLHAARLMAHPRASVDAVAVEMGFGSGTALRHTLRRYTGFTPSEVRARGGLTCVLAAFRDVLLPQVSLIETATVGATIAAEPRRPESLRVDVE